MKKVTWLAILLFISGCANMTPGQKQTAYIIGGLVVVAVVSSSYDHAHAEPNCYFVVNATNSYRVCE